MYGSPFPKLNPRVQYKTALERAGFDVNRGSDANVGASGSQMPPQASQDHWNPKPGSTDNGKKVPVANRSSQQSQGVGIRSKAPFPGQRMASVPQVQVTAASSIRSSDRQPLLVSQVHPSSNIHDNTQQQNNNNNNNNDNNNNNSSIFNFEQLDSTRTNNNGNEYLHHHDDINPIEKSFNMLTQNDTMSGVSQGPWRSHEESFYPHESIVESLDFAPRDNLHISMHPDDETIPLTWHSDKQDGSHTSIKEETKEETHNVVPQTITVPTINTTYHPNDCVQGEEYEVDIQSPVNESSTNMNVEQLISQLDDVSFSRNEKLNPSTNTLGINSSIDPKLKKSSAYMSGFPREHPGIVKPLLNTDSIYNNADEYDHLKSTSPTPPPLPQDINPNNKNAHDNDDNDQESIVSPIKQNNRDDSGSNLQIRTRNSDSTSVLTTTPTFYKFNQDMNQSFYSSSTSLLLPKSGQPAVKANYNDMVNDSENRHEVKLKYPPGEGPCRTCGQDITTKGIFSKKPGELSGQWHKKCFKCTECDIRFNKTTPCYILDDMPYCQQHYHERNNSICKICQQFIEGECLENDKKERFHVNCLTCFLCHKPITQDYFIFNDEIPLCANHDMDSLMTEGLTLSDDNPGNKGKESKMAQRENTLRKRRTRLINFQDNVK